MIVGIINGYYRSGTTFMQLLCSESNPDLIVLSEPTQHEIIDHILANGCNNCNPLHGWEIFKDYCRLPKKVLHEFIKRHFEVFDNDTKQHGIMTSEGAIRYLLQPLDEFDKPVVIKSTQLHLFLDKMKKWYNCWILHLTRSIERIIADHFFYNEIINSEVLKTLLMGKTPIERFFFDKVFENLLKYYNIKEDFSRHNLDKIVFNIMATKKAVEQQSNIIVIDFDDFILRPSQYINKLPFKIDINSLRLIDLSKRNNIPVWLNDMIRDSINYVKNYLR